MFLKNFRENLILFSIVFVPIFTFLLAIKESPFDYTLSMIGNWFDYKTNFIIWGIVTAVLLSIAIYNIYKKANFKNKRAFRFLHLSSIFLVLTVITPTIHQEPIEKELREFFQFNIHALSGVLFFILILISLYMFAKYLSIVNKRLYFKSFKWIIITTGGSLITLVLFGMTGIFELFFFITLSIFLWIVNMQINKHKKLKD